MSKFIKNISLFLAGIPLLASKGGAAMLEEVRIDAPQEPSAVPLRPLNLSTDNLFAGHRSHSSHSSHASHASHYSGSSGSTTTRVSPPPQVNNLSSDDTAAPHVKAPPAAPVAPARPVLSTQEKLKLQIMRVQISLTSLGLYRGPANGVMTAETQTAIRNFQTVKGIPENGMMTTPTLNALGVPAVN